MYFCKQCGTQYQTDDVAVCTNCGTPKGVGNSYCNNCGRPSDPNAAVCTNCGIMLNPTSAAALNPAAKSKLTAGLLAIFLGAYGVHNFYLGYTTKAVIQLVCTLLGILLSIIFIGIFIVIGISVWAIVEGIMILTGKINVDGKGIPLKE